MTPGPVIPGPTDPAKTGPVPDQWSGGDAYEAYMGRWSRLVARRFVAWLGAPPGRRWLDVGCGTGALSATVLAEADPAEVLGLDASSAYVDRARHIADRRAHFEAQDATALAFHGQFDLAVSALMLNFLDQPETAVAGMRRAVVDGGTVAAYVWDYAEGMELLRYFWDAARRLDPQADALDEGIRFPLCQPERLADLWEEADLQDVQIDALEVATVFTDFEDYWVPFLGGQGHAPGYLRSRPDQDVNALRDAVHAALPMADDGSISLMARAWAVRGRRSHR